MQADEGGGNARSADYDLWRISRETEAPDDEATRFLELAALADGTLDEDDRERVAGRITVDPDAMADVAAARAIAAAALPAAPAEIVARGCAAYRGNAAGLGQVVPFPSSWRRGHSEFGGVGRWGSLAAAVVVAGWLGFNLGIEAWSGYSQINRSGDDTIQQLLDPPAGFIRDLNEAPQS